MLAVAYLAGSHHIDQGVCCRSILIYRLLLNRYPDATLQREFAKTAVYKLENLACVDRYAWYALPDGDDGKNGLFDTSGKITDVGKAYKYAHG